MTIKWGERVQMKGDIRYDGCHITFTDNPHPLWGYVPLQET